MPSSALQFLRIPKVTVKSKSLQGCWELLKTLKMLHALRRALLGLGQHLGDNLALLISSVLKDVEEMD